VTNTTRPSGEPDGQERLPVEPLDPLIVADILDALALRQDAVERAFDALARRHGAPNEGGAWTWRTLSSAATHDLFIQLRGWVDWLTVRYDLRAEATLVPGCWYRHPVAVEELTALMVAWQAAYQSPPSPASDALVNWHDRCLWPTLHRLNIQLRVWAKCAGGSHHPVSPLSPPTDNHDFTDFLGALLDSITRPATAPHPPARSPDQPINASRIPDLLATGRAVAVLPDDPLSPIRVDGTWYATTRADRDENAQEVEEAGQHRWEPVPADHAEQLDTLLGRRLAASASVRAWGGDPA